MCGQIRSHMKTLLTAVILILFSGLAWSEESDISRPPRFFSQGIIGKNDGLSMACTGEAPYLEIDCSFVKTMIYQKKGTKVDDKEFDNMPQKEIEKLKQDIHQGLPKMQQKCETGTIEQKSACEDQLQVFTALGKSIDKATFKKAYLNMVGIEEATCKITKSGFDYHFTRLSKNKWLYNPRAMGLCNVVRIATLENNPEYPTLWVFTETLASADQNDICKEWVSDIGTTLVSRWDAPNLFKFDQCKYIEYSSF